MATKTSYWIILSALVILFVLWFLLLHDSLNSFFHIAEWGGYFLIIPITYCIAFLVEKNTLKSTFAVAIGVILSILLARDADYSIILVKIAAVFVGGIVSWGISKIIKTH
ncbi:hypothetical protein [Parabacteroides sp. Marseille-P3160]|uniref:hypothetical protein n=1 Tax=Parabacteroides sp. Marseille-P3160 TaxID=1917887 RepID=UPI0009BAF372|nr:hypothetical protein [Parabacteroides sp. Marseille-P3160]